jgi:AcrR family transcriptional regulator
VRSTSAMDARVRKTRRRLHDALVALIHEKSYPMIVVNDILKRADVGRSAFYAHFHNKDELLASGIEQMLQSTPAPEPAGAVGMLGKTLSFSFPVFSYIGQCRRTSKLRMSRSGRAIVHQHLRQVLADRVAADIEAAERSSRKSTNVPTEVLAEFIVGTFILVLNWWVDSESPLTPHEVDALFLRLVSPTLAAAHRDDALFE